MSMQYITDAVVAPLLPKRAMNASKFDCGRALLICGSMRYLGAPFFIAQAAVNAGCGLVYLSVPEQAVSVLGVKLAEPIFIPRSEVMKQLMTCDACAIGPGLSREEAARELFYHVIVETAVPTVVDADALYFTAQDLSILTKAKSPLVLTPHEGEFVRLCPEFQHEERKMRAHEFAIKNRCVLVLKGESTIVAMPEGELYINTSGNPGMAKGGSGDVLAGIITAFLAQGLSPQDAAICGVYVHGRAGDIACNAFGTLGMTPSDTLCKVKIALKELENV